MELVSSGPVQRSGPLSLSAAGYRLTAAGLLCKTVRGRKPRVESREPNTWAPSGVAGDR
jgi:hypothetical protein